MTAPVCRHCGREHHLFVDQGIDVQTCGKCGEVQDKPQHWNRCVAAPPPPPRVSEPVRKRVASAVIVRTEHGGQRKVLLTMRDGRADFPNHWECPGGKVEPGETDVEALRRELAEELGVHSLTIDPTPIGAVDLDPPRVKKPFVVTFYRVAISPDDPPLPLQARCLAYFEPEALDALPLMPANRALLGQVKAECGAPANEPAPPAARRPALPSVPETLLDGSGSEGYRHTATVANGCVSIYTQELGYDGNGWQYDPDAGACLSQTESAHLARLLAEPTPERRPAREVAEEIAGQFSLNLHPSKFDLLVLVAEEAIKADRADRSPRPRPGCRAERA